MLLAVLFFAATALPEAQAPPAPAVIEPPPSSGTAASAQPFIDSGLAAFKRKRFAKAEVEFRKAVDADPASAAAHFYLGYAQYKIVEPRRPFHPGKQEAAAHFAKSYELDPTFKPVWQMKR